MGKKTETILTLRVKVKVPPGINGQDILEYVRQALTAGPVSMPKGKLDHLEADDVSVSLLKKEINYA